jgi:hypothetical protein
MIDWMKSLRISLFGINKNNAAKISHGFESPKLFRINLNNIFQLFFSQTDA